MQAWLIPQAKNSNPIIFNSQQVKKNQMNLALYFAVFRVNITLNFLNIAQAKVWTGETMKSLIKEALHLNS